MPYTPTVWEDEVPASTPVKYQIVDDVEGAIAGSAVITPVTSITPGTPLAADNLNKLEEGVESATALAEAAIPKNLATAVGDILYATASAVWAKLAKPAANSLLKMTSAGTPSWMNISGVARIFYSYANVTNWNQASKTAGSYSVSRTDMGLPATARFVILLMRAKCATASINNYVIVAPGGGQGIIMHAQVANIWGSIQGIIPLEGPGSLTVTVAGATHDVDLIVVGYFEQEQP